MSFANLKSNMHKYKKIYITLRSHNPNYIYINHNRSKGRKKTQNYYQNMKILKFNIDIKTQNSIIINFNNNSITDIYNNTS